MHRILLNFNLLYTCVYRLALKGEFTLTNSVSGLPRPAGGNFYHQIFLLNTFKLTSVASSPLRCRISPMCPDGYRNSVPAMCSLYEFLIFFPFSHAMARILY
jgi:hypothetical protein